LDNNLYYFFKTLLIAILGKLANEGCMLVISLVVGIVRKLFLPAVAEHGLKVVPAELCLPECAFEFDGPGVILHLSRGCIELGGLHKYASKSGLATFIGSCCSN